MKTVALSAAVLASSLMAYTTAESSERVEMCLRYETQSGWSNAMQVRATVTNGQELAQTTGQWNRFRPLSTYVVVFWEKEQASVIEMSSPIIGFIPLRGTDQQGRTWTASTQDPCR